ncbi:MobQ family relaxase, partial [Pseudoflavonifractor phocaeensis]|uniref:MobQ family relaxase n=1 Tax=Pseudoflavonifractor phocaeensis TaxID=1870988 RepID=UPI0030B8DA3F
ELSPRSDMAALPQQGAAPLAPLTRLSLHTHKNSTPAVGVCTIFAGFHFIREVIPIAIYHCNISIVSRGKGKSAVAAAAYRSGEKLTNEWDGMTHDYTRKGGVVHTEIMLPPHAPPSFSDRSTLWNSVELYEKAGNAQLAREIDAALPIELSREEQIRLVREYCSSQFVSRGMCVDYAIHDTGKGNPHCHIMLTVRPLDKRGAWAAKSRKEYDLDENGERIRLPSGRYKTHKVDLTGWNDKGNALLWRKEWADLTNNFLERNGSPQRIDYRSNAERGIDEIPTVHMGVAACQMEKKGIATEKGELNRNIQKANRLIREIRAQVGKLKEWIADLFKVRETAPEQPPQSPGLANLMMKYLSVQREKSRKYSQSWQRQHAADELKTVAAAVNYLSEHGISTLDELDAALSSVSEQADAIRAGMKTAEQRMKELQKLIEYGRNYTEYKPIHDELKKLKNGWTNKRDKYEETHRAELTLWNAASRYLHANLPKGTKPPLPISEWEKEYATLSGQRTAEYTKLKETRAEVAELHNIRKCVDIALKADQPEQTQSRTKRQEQER